MPSLTSDQRELLGEFEDALKTHLTASDPRFQKIEDDIRALKQRGLITSAQDPNIGIPMSTGMSIAESRHFKDWNTTGGQRGRCIIPTPIEGLRTKAFQSNARMLNPIRQAPSEIYAFPRPRPVLSEQIPWRVNNVEGAQYDLMRETAPVNPGAAIQAGEGSQKQEVDISIMLQSVRYETIACWSAASTQVLSDIGGLSRFFDESLRAAVLEKLCGEILLGTGTTNPGAASTPFSLVGMLSVAAAYDPLLTDANDSRIDVVSHAATQMQNLLFTTPDTLVVNATSAEKLRLTKDGDSVYVWGSPSQATDQIWGLNTIIDSHMPADTFMLFENSPRTLELIVRQDLVSELSREHSDYFTRNLVALRCEMRCALAIYRPSAILSGTWPSSMPFAPVQQPAGALTPNHKK